MSGLPFFPDISVHMLHDTSRGHQYLNEDLAKKAAVADDARLQTAIKTLNTKLHSKDADGVQTHLDAGLAGADKGFTASYKLNEDFSHSYSYADTITDAYTGAKGEKFRIKLNGDSYEIPVTHDNLVKLAAAFNDARTDKVDGVAGSASKISAGHALNDDEILSGISKVFKKDLADFKIR